MEKSIIISNLDPLATESEIRREIGGPIPIISMTQITDFYANQKVFFLLFHIKTTQIGYNEAMSVKNAYKVRGRIIRFTPLEDYLKNESGAVLFGESKYTTTNDILYSLQKYGVTKVRIISTSIGNAFFLSFKSETDLHMFLVVKKCCIINSRLYYARRFPIIEIQKQKEEEIKQDFLERKLSFVIGGKEYEVPLYVACAASSLVRDALTKDPNTTKIDLGNVEGPFASIVDLFNGKELNIINDPFFYYHIGMRLGIDILMKAAELFYYNKLTTQNIIASTKLALECNNGIQVHLRYVRYHHDEVSKDPAFKSIAEPLLKFANQEARKKKFLTKELFDEVIANTSIDLNTQREKLRKLIYSGLK